MCRLLGVPFALHHTKAAVTILVNVGVKIAVHFHLVILDGQEGIALFPCYISFNDIE